MTDEDIETIRRIVNEALDARGLKTLPSAAALRMRRMREQKRNAEANKSVTVKGRKRNKGVTPERTQAPTATTWTAYAQAYLERYGVEPTRNATVNGQLAQFVTRVPVAEAAQIAVFFVRHNKHFYISSRHAVGALLRDAEGLRTEWLSGRMVTDTEARQADRTQTNANVWGKLIAETEK